MAQLQADVYGPSVPTMINIHQNPGVNSGNISIFQYIVFQSVEENVEHDLRVNSLILRKRKVVFQKSGGEQRWL